METTVFGEVLTEVLEKRGVPATPEGVRKFARDAGLNPTPIIRRMKRRGARVPNLYEFAVTLGLDVREKMQLALAYSLESRS